MNVVILFSLFFFLVVPGRGTEQKPNNEVVQKVPVLIIGAGISGVTCGRYLADHGMTDFMIVEADDRVGGRMRPFEFQGYTLELGANWIEGTVGNPLWTFKEKLDLKGNATNFNDVMMYYHDDDGNLKRSFGHDLPMWDIFDRAINDSFKLSIRMQNESAQDISLRTALQISGWNPVTPLEQALEFSTVDFETGDVPEGTSLINQWPLDTFLKYKEEQFMILDQRGYVAIVHDLIHNANFITSSSTADDESSSAIVEISLDGANFVPNATSAEKSNNNGLDISSRILLNQKVKTVRWNLTNEAGEKVIHVIMETGEIYEAYFVVSTVSIGVLQYQEIKFEPTLPSWKLEGIYMDEMAVYTKIFMQFHECFWDDNEFFLYASEQRGYYSYWQNMNHPKYFPGSNILMVTATTPESIRIEQQSVEKTIDEAVAVLETIFLEKVNAKNHSNGGVDRRKILRPKAVEIPRWKSDPLTRGSFTNWPIGFTDKQKEKLKGTVNGNLLFSGEGTNDMSGYVHGGFFSGIETAQQLLSEPRFSKPLISEKTEVIQRN
eukprot:TRINITY_DN7711_c0_g1_i5.p1 TRINITY_DN7711_c0_g1~~TRINITY_DN7711_c0_g1_i5.p1  ORF type:complete len:549 (+),score=145.56 TRINITY_DN7711_c0_g1_i5:87-1733(+)